MIKQHSWTRQQYELAYGICRSYGEINEEQWTDTLPQEIIRAADYSYKANGYNFTGWVNNIRFIKFFNAMQSNRYSLWSIPF